MNNKRRHILLRLICTLLTVLFLWSLGSSSLFYASGQDCYFSGDAEVYYNGLIESGFPQDYAIRLTELHLLHPVWSFEPLLITQGKAAYTWDYVIEKETEEPDNNLIYASDTYAAYRHPTNTDLFDSGHYQASVETVEYFMDPRNFLNETDIFQFYDLAAQTDGSADAVVAVLSGTFMENAVLENGKTYAEYFCHVGTALGINPVYLATKARQEQGIDGTSPILSGTCGTLLAKYYIEQTQTSEQGNSILAPAEGHTEEDLKALDGLYNVYNVGASGNGLFSIYYNAMNRAKTGTAGMEQEWDGSASWTTLWKSIYGGAAVLKNSYIDRYQSTIYLQKFNVDSRAGNRNFWAQYMQNITGAMSEARSLFNSFAAIDGLDLPCTFLIPVYEGMPEMPSVDPANGACSATLPASARFTYQTSLTNPDTQERADAPIYNDLDALYATPLQFSGTVSHTYGIKGIEYSLDGGEWIRISDDDKFNFTLNEDFSEGSRHILVIRGDADYDSTVSSKKNSYQVLCAVFYLKAVRPEVTLSLEMEGRLTQQTCKAGSTVTLPVCESSDFVGWMTSDDCLYPSGAQIEIKRDMTCQALFLTFRKLEGAALSTDGLPPRLRFSAIMDEKVYGRLVGEDAPKIKLSAQVSALNSQNTEVEVHVAHYEGTDSLLRLDASTPELTQAQYDLLYTAVFTAEIKYEDGSTRTMTASGELTERSARQVAQAALADTSAQYSKTVLAYLKTIADTNQP